MQHILRFFAKNGPFFTWLVLAILSIILLCQTNPYHRSIWFSGANFVSGGVYEVVDGCSGYFGLRTINGELMTKLAEVEEENQSLRQELQNLTDINRVLESPRPYTYRVARVINSTITQAENYLILNIGEKDSVKVGMAVIDHNGVVGKIAKVSGHFSQVISLLNAKLQISACLADSESAGTLIWDGQSPLFARINDLPRNVDVSIGDTVITTGFGGSFPRGVPVGVIDSPLETSDNNFLSFKVKLFTHFDRINEVQVIQNNEPCPF